MLEYYNAMIARQRIDYAICQGEELGAAGSTRSGDSRAVIERVELRDASGARAPLRSARP